MAQTVRFRHSNMVALNTNIFLWDHWNTFWPTLSKRPQTHAPTHLNEQKGMMPTLLGLA